MEPLLLAGLLALTVPPLDAPLHPPRSGPWIKLDVAPITLPKIEAPEPFEVVEIIAERVPVPEDPKMLVPAPPCPPDPKIYRQVPGELVVPDRKPRK